MFLAKRGQTDLKNETNMISIALDDFTLVSGGHEVSFYSGAQKGNQITILAKNKYFCSILQQNRQKM